MRYVLGFLVSIGLVVLVVVLVIRGISGGGETKNQTPLSDYASTDAVMQLVVDGPIIADQDHRAFRITVGNSQVTVEALKGYQFETIESKAFTNNQESYTNFLRAIDAAGFSRGNEKSPNTNPKGTCPSGSRVNLKIWNGATEVQNYWTTSCGGQGNFKGNLQQVRSLFVKQVPKTDQRIVGRLGL